MRVSCSIHAVCNTVTPVGEPPYSASRYSADCQLWQFWHLWQFWQFSISPSIYITNVPLWTENIWDKLGLIVSPVELSRLISAKFLLVHRHGGHGMRRRT